MRTIFDFLQEPLEALYLRRFLAGSDTPALRLSYAARLDSVDPLRAEWLRLDVATRDADGAEPEAGARAAELAAQIDPTWLSLMRRETMLNCGRGLGLSPRVRFTFVCDRHWEELTPTAEPRVRHCGGCAKLVHFTDSVPEAEALARRGECIAVPKRLSGGGISLDTSNMLGRPDPLGNWAARLFPEDR